MPYKNKKKQREYQNRWIQARRLQWLRENGPCKKCGSWDNLEVDHIDPDKKEDHRIWSWSLKRREIELKKCQVLCEKCHLDKTKTHYEKTRKHGTYGMYRKWKCRCNQCYAAAKIEWAHWHSVARNSGVAQR